MRSEGLYVNENSNDISWDGFLFFVCIILMSFAQILYSLFIPFLTSQVCFKFRVWYACTHKLLAASCLLGVVGWPVVCHSLVMDSGATPVTPLLRILYCRHVTIVGPWRP